MYRAKKREIAIMNVRFAATAVAFTLERMRFDSTEIQRTQVRLLTLMKGSTGRCSPSTTAWTNMRWAQPLMYMRP
jgi:hypothetical protein